MVTEITARTNEAIALKNAGRHVEAIDLLANIATMAPDNLALQHNHAAALGDAGRNREAVMVLERAFQRGLNAPQSWLVFARALAGVQDFERARTAFFQLLRFNPYSPDVHKELAQLIWMQTGEQDKALEIVNEALRANPAAKALYITRAQILGQTGDANAEYAEIRRLADKNPNTPELSMALCNSALACEKIAEAVGYGKAAFDAARENDSAVSAYATALLAAGEASQAAGVIEILRARQPVNQFFIALEATAWRLTGDPRYEAIFDYDSLVFAAPLEPPAAWRTLDAYLADLTEALEEAHDFQEHPFNQSVRHGSQISSVTGSDNPALKAYGDAALRPVRRFTEALGVGDDVLRNRNIGGFRFFSTWSISLPPGGFHVNHVHPEGWLSSACHIRPAPDDPENECAGWLKFGEPGITTAPALTPQRFVKPEPGVLVLFPSYMWHGTVGFEAGDARLTIAADIVPASA